MYHLTEAYLMAAYISTLAAYWGALIFGTAVVAPIAVTRLDEAPAASFLRRYWLVYHRFAVLGGFLLTAVAALAAGFSAVPIVYGLLCVSIGALMTVIFYVALTLIPKINLARDRRESKRFDRLHRMDVGLVGLGILTGLILMLAVIYVLPGQFTFWPTAGAHA